jgi:hypothetical protein
MKAWRCDLTALSYTHNLYFVACNDTIRVYQPSFPDQTFSSDPVLILHPPISSPYLSPYMDEDDPHSITRVLVAYLGNVEVLLVTCDDGDVIGWRVEEIHRALTMKCEENEMEEVEVEVEVRTFLHRNVGQSAWGLAVHREARMIAISANTHEITVLAYALAGQDDGKEFLDGDEDGVGEDEKSDFPKLRTKDHVITLKANHNVPAVSFNNTAEDKEGRWLFSTCINGEVRLWDLHHPDEPARIYEMGFCPSAQAADRAPRTRLGKCGCENKGSFPHGTWGALWLDEKAAYEIEEGDERREEVDGASFFDDAEMQKERFGEKRMEGEDEDTTEDSDGEMELSDSDSDYDSDSLDNGDVGPEMEDEHMSLDSDSNTEEDDGELNDAGESDEEEDDDNNTPAYTGPPLPSMQTLTHLTHDIHNAMHTVYQTMQINVLAAPNAHNAFHSDEVVDGVHPLSSWPPFFNPAAIHPFPRSTPYFQITTSHASPSSSIPSSPSLIISQDTLFLRSPNPHIPILTLRSPLGPAHSSKPSHRLCFSHYIAELDVFIVASPVGRAAVFAVTKCKQPGPDGGAGTSWKFGFRLEHVLPVTYGFRMMSKRLVGVAVGPVQGMCDGEELEWGWGERRWRLMMYFTDHSVVAYELSRKRNGSQVGELVV